MAVTGREICTPSEKPDNAQGNPVGHALAFSVCNLDVLHVLVNVAWMMPRGRSVEIQSANGLSGLEVNAYVSLIDGAFFGGSKYSSCVRVVEENCRFERRDCDWMA